MQCIPFRQRYPVCQDFLQYVLGKQKGICTILTAKILKKIEFINNDQPEEVWSTERKGVSEAVIAELSVVNQKGMQEWRRGYANKQCRAPKD